MTSRHISRFGVVGHPVAHSQSPFIHHAFAHQTGLELNYEKILAPLDGFDETVMQFFRTGGRGLNVTVPFKQDAFRLARAHLSQRADQASAVNTLWMHNNTLHGCNTDGAGLVADLTRLGHAPASKRILLLGAGGAARGAIPALLEAGCKTLHIANRTASRALQLLEAFASDAILHKASLSAGALADIQGNWDVVINATSSSLNTNNTLDVNLRYAPSALAYDMAYGARPTSFLEQAALQGAHDRADGLGMLVSQAAISFFIWHGIEPDPSPVLAALRTRLSDNNAQS